MASTRRTFLAQSAAAALAAACSPGAPASDPSSSERGLDPVTLDALARAVLPSELGEDGMARVSGEFRSWLADYRPVTEQNHGYGTSEIRYGPPDPAPNWQAQLEALDLEARQRFDQPFSGMAVDERRELVRVHLRRFPGERMPSPLEAPHVALGLLAWFYDSPEANDLCHGAEIRMYSCRGLATLGDEPSPHGSGGGS